ncbi:MAG: redoxin domain-containing protein [Terriglobales bacterium]
MRSKYRTLALAGAMGATIVVYAMGQAATGPSDPKAQKTFKKAQDLESKHATASALDYFKKADKQDGGHCVACQDNMIENGIQIQDWKTAELGATERIAEAHDSQALAIAHYELGLVRMREGMTKHKDELFGQAHDEFAKALAAVPSFPGAIYGDGIALGHLKQDDAAKARFEQFIKLRPEGDTDRQRALRYASDPELIRARMAPAFAITTSDDRHISLDDLKGKVVLLDFWATWCPSCREAVPHIRKIAKTFEGQPFVVISISLDSDEEKWKDFVTKNEMTWIQYRDGDFPGHVAALFAVHAIPQTFTIDANGVLQDQHTGDESIEGKLKKLIAQANEMQTTKIASQ